MYVIVLHFMTDMEVLINVCHVEFSQQLSLHSEGIRLLSKGKLSDNNVSTIIW